MPDPPPKPLIIFTVHARIKLSQRRISATWVEDTVRTPDWVEADRNDPTVERRFRAIPEFGNRILRVACVETETTIRVISLMFDRTARRKP
jgi:uncharacterized DUF497 family protein